MTDTKAGASGAQELKDLLDKLRNLGDRVDTLDRSLTEGGEAWGECGDARAHVWRAYQNLLNTQRALGTVSARERTRTGESRAREAVCKIRKIVQKAIQKVEKDQCRDPAKTEFSNGWTRGSLWASGEAKLRFEEVLEIAKEAEGNE